MAQDKVPCEACEGQPMTKTKAAQRVDRLSRNVNRLSNAVRIAKEKSERAFNLWSDAWWKLTEKERDSLRTQKERMGD